MKSFPENPILRYLFYLLAVLPIFLLRDFTLDNELRYLSIADEALHKGTLFTFSNHGIPYADKPPLYLWIVMAGKMLFGYHNMLFLSLFSFIPALLIIHVMGQWVKPLLSKIERLMAELLLLTSSFYIGTAIVLRMDMLMTMFIVLSLHTFFKMYNGTAKPRDSILFPIFVFLAIFSKGPIGLIVPILSTTVFLFIKKDIQSIGKYWGWKTSAILIFFCTTWFSGVYAESGQSYLFNLLFNQTVNRAVQSFYHNEPIYYYLTAIWYSLAPWSLLYIGVVVVGIKKKLVSTDLELFFLVIACSTLAVLSLFSSKLEIYMLPSFPFLVYLSVLWLQKIGSPRWVLMLVSVPAILFIMTLPGVIVSQFFNFNSSKLVLLAALILTCSGFIALKYLKKIQLNRSVITMTSGVLLAAFTISFAIPRYNALIGLGELCQEAKTISAKKGVANYYYCKITRADNLDIYLGVPPRQLMIHDLFETHGQIKKPAILFLSEKSIERNDSLQLFIKGKKIHHSGNYYCVEIDI